MAQTPFERIVASIVSRTRFGMRPGLDRIIPLLSSLGSPHRSFPSIHVVGTNGKGSTAAFLASILTAGGYRTGFYSSPHLCSYTERFRIDGREIGQDRLVSIATRVIHLAPPDATFFEITTAIALLWFAEEGVDIAILEAGMGGRLDATHAVMGIMTLMTPIALDHTQWLGGTLGAIACEKIGIAARGTPIVSALQPAEITPLIVDRVAANDSPLWLGGRDFSGRFEGGLFHYRGIERSIPPLVPGIGGFYQETNLPVALAAAELLSQRSFPLSDEAIRRGVETARWPGRMELFPGSPPILLDGAHNPAGASALVRELDHRDPGGLVFLVGVVDDKDLGGIMEPLLSLGGRFVTVTPPVDRGVDAARLAGFIRSRGGDATAVNDPGGGLSLACRVAGPAGCVVVSGSLYLVGAVRGILTGVSSTPVRG